MEVIIMDSIFQIVGSLGFPIAISVYILYFCNTELKEMRKTIENNTLTIQKLIDKLDKEE